MKNDRAISTVLLGLSIALFVSIWGTFHNIAWVQKAWIAFLSAAVYFAAGHRIKDSINVALSHLLGVGWGLAVLYLFASPVVVMNPTLYIFLTLAFFGFMSAVVTNMGIRLLSHTPSLFCGWAIAFAAFGGVPISQWTTAAVGEVFLACILGVLFIGIGISQLHGLLLKAFSKSRHNEDDREKTDETGPKTIKPAVKLETKTMADSKMETYLQSYSSPESEAAGDRREIKELRSEIIRLRQSLSDIPYVTGSTAAKGGGASNARVKIIGVCGSPHKKGSTIEYLKVALDAAKEIGNVETELIELAGKEIKPCMGCKSDRCGGTCVISDYMQELYPKLRECDGLILASPSYFGTFSGQLKLFLDRLRVMRHTNFELGNVVVGTLAVAGRRHGGQEITNLDLIQSMMRHNTIIVNDGTAVCQLGATGWSHTFDDPAKKADTDDYGMQTAVGVGKRVAEIAKVVKESGLQNVIYEYNQKIGKR